jgi:hypothetical protein
LKASLIPLHFLPYQAFRTPLPILSAELVSNPPKKAEAQVPGTCKGLERGVFPVAYRVCVSAGGARTWAVFLLTYLGSDGFVIMVEDLDERLDECPGIV